MGKDTKYLAVAQDEGEEGDALTRVSRDRSRLRDPFFLFNICFFLFSSLILALSYSKRHITFKDAARIASHHSAALEQINFSSVAKATYGPLFNEDSSIYRQWPSPEVDAAWHAMTETPFFTISSSEVQKLGKDPSLAATAPAEWNLSSSEPQHIVTTDGQHVLHCLDAVRRYAYREHYYPDWRTLAEDAPELSRAHLSHCLGILLDALTCEASLDLVTFRWLDGLDDQPYPDFAVEKTCRDHAAILDWQRRRRVDTAELWDRYPPTQPQDGTAGRAKPGALLADWMNRTGQQPGAARHASGHH